MSRLAELQVEELRQALASPRAEAGGGTAVLVSASFGASLMAMAGAVTARHGSSPRLEELSAWADHTARRLLDLAEEDGLSYSRVLEARRLPRETAEERAFREARIEAALREALRIPLEAARTCLELLEACPALLDLCRPATHSDLGSAALLLGSGLRGSLFNVRQNCKSWPEPQGYLDQARALQDRAEELLPQILRRVEEA